MTVSTAANLSAAEVRLGKSGILGWSYWVRVTSHHRRDDCSLWRSATASGSPEQGLSRANGMRISAINGRGGVRTSPSRVHTPVGVEHPPMQENGDVGFVRVADVAAYAGVSPGTVSNYFHNPARVAEATAERIRGAIDELGYVPNDAARSLRRRETKTIGHLA